MSPGVKILKSLVLWKIFSVIPTMRHAQQKPRSSATSERLTAIYRSHVEMTNPALPFPDCEADPCVVVAVSQELWFMVKQVWLLSSPVPSSRNDTHIHAYSFFLLHTVISKLVKVIICICVRFREVPFLCDILKHSQHIHRISYSANHSKEWKCSSSPRALGRISLETTLQCKWFRCGCPLLF